MQYPHEREERKNLYAALIDNSHSDLFLKSVAVLILGVAVVSTALVDSLLLHPEQNAKAWQWLTFWTTSFLFLSLVIFILPKLLPSQKQKKLYGIKRSFVIKSVFPAAISGAVVTWAVGLESYDNLPLAACLLSCFYALSILSISGFSRPLIKNYAISTIVISLSLLVISTRHNIEVIAPHHFANISFIASVGLPSIAVGLWKSVIKRH